MSFAQLSVFRSFNDNQPALAIYESDGVVHLNVIYPNEGYVLDHVGMAGNGIVIVYERNVYDNSTLSYYATVNERGIRKIPGSEVSQAFEPEPPEPNPWGSLDIRMQQAPISQEVVRIAPGGDVVRISIDAFSAKTRIAVWDRELAKFTGDVLSTYLPPDAPFVNCNSILTINGVLLLLETNSDTPQMTMINRKTRSVQRISLKNTIASGRSITESPTFYSRGFETPYREFAAEGDGGGTIPEYSLWMEGAEGGYIPWLQFFLLEDSELLILENTAEDDFIIPPIPRYEIPPPGLRKVYA